MIRRSTSPAKRRSVVSRSAFASSYLPRCFGGQLYVMHRWLDATLGREAYW
jgi:hypothetical protein